MSNFELRYTELSGIRSRVQGVGGNLANCSTRLRRQASLLSGQRGFGIEQVCAGIRSTSTSASKLSQNSYTIASFLADLERNVTDSEDQAYRALAGALPKEIKLTDILVAWAPAIVLPTWPWWIPFLPMLPGVSPLIDAFAQWAQDWLNKPDPTPATPTPGTSEPSPNPSSGGTTKPETAPEPPPAATPEAIRYVSQIPGGAGYDASHWGSYNPKDGCAVACVSMALSSMGVDLLPKDVCKNNSNAGQKNPVNMVWAKSGKCTINTSGGLGGLNAALDKYKADPNKYAAPIIKLPDKQHYVLVTGKNADGSYTIMDPASQKTTVWKGSSSPQVIQYYK